MTWLGRQPQSLAFIDGEPRVVNEPIKYADAAKEVQVLYYLVRRRPSTPSLNTIIDQAVGTTSGASTAATGIPDFLTPGFSSISGSFAFLWACARRLGWWFGRHPSGTAFSSSLLGGRLINGYISGARVYQDQDGDGVTTSMSLRRHRLGRKL